MKQLNWLAVVGSIVAGMGIGVLWYGAIFNGQWMAGNGIIEQGGKFFKNGVEMSGSPMPMIFNVVCMAVYALIMNWLLGKMGETTWLGGATVGAAIGR